MKGILSGFFLVVHLLVISQTPLTDFADTCDFCMASLEGTAFVKPPFPEVIKSNENKTVDTFIITDQTIVDALAGLHLKKEF